MIRLDWMITEEQELERKIDGLFMTNSWSTTEKKVTQIQNRSQFNVNQSCFHLFNKCCKSQIANSFRRSSNMITYVNIRGKQACILSPSVPEYMTQQPKSLLKKAT